MARPAVFLDRDGTINEEVHYLSRPEDCRLIPGAGQALARLTRAGYALVVVSNQSGLARGYFSQADLAAVNRRLVEQLAEHGALVDAFYHCPHLAPEKGGVVDGYAIDCDCRKPSPGMVLKAASEHGLALDNRSYMIGDRLRDVACGKAAGLVSILVTCGQDNPPPAFPLETPDLVAEDLARAVEWILSHEEGSRP